MRKALFLARGCAATKHDNPSRDNYFAIVASLQYTSVRWEAHSTKITKLPEQTTNMRIIAKPPSTVSV